MKESYFEKLRDPRWQKKRLEVMQRDNFTCRFCGDDKNTLNVHHLRYHGDPWMSPSRDLITTCELCHEVVEGLKGSVKDPMSIKIFSYRAVFPVETDFAATFSDFYPILSITANGKNRGTAIIIDDGLIDKLREIVEYYKYRKQ